MLLELPKHFAFTAPIHSKNIFAHFHTSPFTDLDYIEDLHCTSPLKMFMFLLAGYLANYCLIRDNKNRQLEIYLQLTYHESA